MPKISRENTLVRKVSLVEKFLCCGNPQQRKNSPKHKHLIGFAFPFRNGVETNSTIPGEEKYFAEKHSKLIMLRMGSNFSHEIFRISLVVELI
jgi:hypothetical protein